MIMIEVALPSAASFGLTKKTLEWLKLEF